MGAAALVCLTQLTTSVPAIASATVPVLLVAVVTGLVLGRARLRKSLSLAPAALAAAGVFIVAGLPVIATGSPTFAGYTVLGDTAVHFSGAEELLERGRDASGLAPSNYSSNFRAYYTENAYPSGGATALGALARLVHQDAAWVFQPLLSFLLALLSLTIFGLVRPHLRSSGGAALVAFTAAQPALLVAFAMQGSLKEVAAALMLALLVALMPSAVTRAAGWREAIPLAVAAAAAIGVMGPAVGVWVGPIVAAAFLFARSNGRSIRSLAAMAGGVALTVGLLASQTLSLADTASRAATSVASVGEVGNLLRPLDLDQALGVWLTGDYRVAPVGTFLFGTRLLEALILGAAAVGVACCISRKAWMPLLYGGALAFGSAIVVVRGSAWADAKALAIVSPSIVLLAMFGAVAQAQRRRVLAGLVAAGISIGVVGSNALIYRSASLAPHDRLTELADVGERLNGSGPLLFSEFDDFAPYFLRDAQPEPAPLLIASPGEGPTPVRGAAADLDGMTLADLERYPALLTRKGPIGSRPSSVYRKDFETEHFTAWRRSASPQAVGARLALGESPRVPTGPAPCDAVRRLADEAGPTGSLAFAGPPTVVVVDPLESELPPGWRRDRDDPALTLASGGGRAAAAVEVSDAGRYAVWLEGSFGRETAVEIDGRRVGTVRNRLSGRRVAERLGTVHLQSGEHVVALERRPAGLAPGSGGLYRTVGPVYLVREAGARLGTVPAARWESLCGRNLDWMEALA